MLYPSRRSPVQGAPVCSPSLKRGTRHGWSSMKRSILTGTPGAGKTSMLYVLKNRGYAGIEEATTAVIALKRRPGNAEPWMQPDFIDTLVRLQTQRQMETSTHPDMFQLYDRSCTLALSRYPGYPPLPACEKNWRELHTSRGRCCLSKILGFASPLRQEERVSKNLSFSRTSTCSPAPLWATT